MDMKTKTGTYTHFVANNPANLRIANAIQGMFSGVSIRITPEVIYFETPDHAAIVSIRAAYQ